MSTRRSEDLVAGLGNKAIYHAVPPSMTGEVLFPLNDLKHKHPDLYQAQRAKYAGREEVLGFRIPGMGVLWNDALHCAPIHPYFVARARAEAGVAGSAFAAKCFRIPLDRLRRHRVIYYANATFWINGRPGEDVPAEPPVEEFSDFDPDRYHELTDVPGTYRSFLSEMKSLGRRPLTFPTIPHILVGGPIDVSGLAVVRADEPPPSA